MNIEQKAIKDGQARRILNYVKYINRKIIGMISYRYVHVLCRSPDKCLSDKLEPLCFICLVSQHNKTHLPYRNSQKRYVGQIKQRIHQA